MGKSVDKLRIVQRGTPCLVGPEGGEVVRVADCELHLLCLRLVPLAEGRGEGGAVAEGGGDGEGGVQAPEDGAEQQQLTHPTERSFNGVARFHDCDVFCLALIIL